MSTKWSADTGIPESSRRRITQQLLVLLGAFLAARILFIVCMPAVYSIDLHSWLQVMDVLQAGGNPYGQTGVLNWPPFWMQILFAIHQVAKHTGLSPILLIQATLIACESAVMVLTYIICRRFFSVKNILPALLSGLALSPASIFLSCQHCNYDVFVGLWILLATWMLMEYAAGGSKEAWLAACFFVGMGILAKTVPVVLTPLLLIGFRRLSWPTKAFGAALLAAPFTIGMSVLFTLEPYGVLRNVIGYRSAIGWYGITGLLLKGGWPEAMLAYQRLSPLLFIALMGFMAIQCYRKSSLQPKQILILSALLLMFIPTFGPGYSPPYILWYLPLLVVLYAASGTALRRMLLAGWIVASLTYIIEYALFRSHGAFLLQWYPSAAIHALSAAAGSRGGQVLIRLPLFFLYLALFFALARKLREREAPLSVVNSQS